MIARLRIAIVSSALVLFAAAGAYLIFSHPVQGQQRNFNLTLVGDSANPSKLQATQGDMLTVTVTADREEEVHIHGYDRRFFIKPTVPAVQSFPADITGTFDIEIHKQNGDHVVIGQLEVVPATGAVFGGGRSSSPPAAGYASLSHTHTVTQTINTRTYSILLNVGPIQPGSGERVLRGTLVSIPAGDPGYEMVVHIYDRKSGRLVSDATPTMSIRDTRSGAASEVPVAVLQAADAGPNDIHYGNNVSLPPSIYAIAVRIAGESATFQLAT